MTGSGAPAPGSLDGSGLHVAILASRWHDQVMAALVAGASRALEDARVVDATLVRVPGSFELPVVARELCASGFDAVVALGVVIRGGTPHFDYVCRAVTDGIVRVALDSGVPIGFGVLTCDDEAQAIDRAGLSESHEDKGYEAAHAAVETALALRSLRAHHG